MAVWCVYFILSIFFVLKVSEASSRVGSYTASTGLFHSVQESEVNSHGKTFTSCGDGYCVCQETYADCSLTNLTYIPVLPPRIYHLNFTHNRLLEIDSDDFFVNVTKLTTLQLGANGLRFISPAAFTPLKHLRILDLGYNNLTYTTLSPALSVTTLVILKLIGMELGPPPDDLFHRYPLPHLEELQLYLNRILCVNMSVFVPLPNLRKLTLSSNNFNIMYADRLPGLIYLNLGNSSIQDFPETCRNSSSLYPSLQELRIRGARISFIPTEICLPRLKTLDISSNAIRVFTSGMLSSHKFQMLQLADLSAMTFRITQIEMYAFNNSELLSLSLMYTNIDFSYDSVDPDMFAGCPNLRSVQLSHNNFRDVSERKFTQLFRPLSKLRKLYLGSSSVSKVGAAYFKELTSLTEIYLYDNVLNDIPDGTFDSLGKITKLVLERNQIQLVRETTFSAATRRRLGHLDVSTNPFVCNCDLLWFRNWYVSNVTLFKNKWNNGYFCSNIPNTTLAAFYMNEQACLLSREVNVLIIVCLVNVIVIFTAVLLLHRYRWHIRLLLYEAFRGRGDRWRRLQADHFQYDVFVSYAEEDFHWVQQHLVPELENRRGLKLCLHQRDFIPGKHIVDNIADCVESSKKVMMVFSSDFAKSPWCQFELTLCLTHVMDHDDALVITCLHDIPSRDLTPAMMAVMKTTTYIEWSHEPDATASFWGRIGIALSDILSVERPNSF